MWELPKRACAIRFSLDTFCAVVAAENSFLYCLMDVFGRRGLARGGPFPTGIPFSFRPRGEEVHLDRLDHHCFVKKVR